MVSGGAGILNEVARVSLTERDLGEAKHLCMLTSQGKVFQIQETALPKPYILGQV